MLLAEYQKVYNEVNASYESQYIDPKPGIYVCRCTKGEYKYINKGDKDYHKFSWTLQITEGALNGQRFQKVEFLPNSPEKAGVMLSYIKGTLERCGVHPPVNVQDLPIAMSKCAGAEVEVVVSDSDAKTKEGKFIKNIKFTKQLAVQSTANDGDTSDFSSPNEITTEIPF